MQTLTITAITLNPTPSVNTLCTVYYSLGSDPTTWILIANNVNVPPSGILATALVVSGISDSETNVNVRAVANCGGTPFDENVPTGTTTTTTTGGTTTTTTSATTTTTTTGGTTTTTTAATTTTTTTAGTTTTTTAGTTTTTTTAAPEAFDLVITKDVDGDTVFVSLDGGSTFPYVSNPGDPNPKTFTGVIDSTLTYFFFLNLTPSGRPNAPIDVTNSGAIVNCPGCTHVEQPGVNGSGGNINVVIGI